LEPLESKNVILGHKNGIKLFKTQTFIQKINYLPTFETNKILLLLIVYGQM